MAAKRPERLSRQLLTTNILVAGQVSGSPNPIFGLTGQRRRILELDVDQVFPDPDQPRQFFDEIEIEDLAASFERTGQLQPILVREQEDRHYIINDGERRWRAACLRGQRTIEAIVTTGDPAEISLLANLQRSQLGPFEEARGYKRLMAEHGYTQEQLADIVKKNRADVARSLQYLNLPAEVLADHESAREMARATIYEITLEKEPVKQLALWEMARSGATTKAIHLARIITSSAIPQGEGQLHRHGNWKTVARTATKITQHLNALPIREITEKERAALLSLYKRLDQILGAKEEDADPS